MADLVVFPGGKKDDPETEWLVPQEDRDILLAMLNPLVDAVKAGLIANMAVVTQDNKDEPGVWWMEDWEPGYPLVHAADTLHHHLMDACPIIEVELVEDDEPEGAA